MSEELKEISKVKIRNFRNLGDISIDFTKSPIISLVGDNGAGKSNCIEALKTCWVHNDPRNQKECIKEGTRGFGISTEFTDGSELIRIKTPSQNTYRYVEDGEEKWCLDRIDGSGVPQEVYKLMSLGVEPETKQYLNFRTYEDTLMFVYTPGSTNYKVMYDALKIANISQAIKNGQNEANKLKFSINSNEGSIVQYIRAIRNIRDIEIEPLKVIKDRVKQELAKYSKLRKAVELKQSIEKLRRESEALILIDTAQEIREVDAERVNRIEYSIKDIGRLLREQNAIAEISNAQEIEERTLYNINNIRQFIEGYRVASKEFEKYSIIEDANEINEQIIHNINNAMSEREVLKEKENKYVYNQLDSMQEVSTESINKINSIYSLVDAYKKCEELREKVKDYENKADEVYNSIKELGVAVTECPNCGSEVIVEIS